MCADFNSTDRNEVKEELQRTSERLEASQKIVSRILEAESPQAIAEIALEHLERMVPSTISAISLFQPDYSMAVLLTNRHGRMMPGEMVPAEQSYVEALQRNQTVVVNDLTNLRKHTAAQKTLLKLGARTLLSVPLLAQGELIGAMSLIDSKADAFSEQDIQIAQQVGNNVAIAIHNARLLEKEQRARREAETLREVAANFSASLGQEELLDLILAQLERVLPYDRATIFLQVEDEFVVAARRGQNIRPLELFLQTGDMPRNILAVIDEQQPKIVADTSSDPDWIVYPGGEFIQCWLGVPLTTKKAFLGLLMLDNEEPRIYTEEDAVLALAFANHAAIAIENANLYSEIRQYAEVLETRVAERTRELGALYEITAVSSQYLELQETLDRIISKISAAMDCATVTIQILNETGDLLCLAAQQGLSPPMIEYMQELPADNIFMDKILSSNEPYILKEAKTDPRLSEVPVNIPATFSVGTPIHASGEVLGILGIAVVRPQPPSREDIALLTSIADQIGVTIENARLQQQSEQLAVLEERERLARDLHDSATQSLFSLTLFAAAAREHLGSGQLESVRKQLVELEETAIQTHKEMRLLLYELRPTILPEEGLEEALRRRMQMVEFRSGIRGQINAILEKKLPFSVEEVLFQVASEALNNALKHSRADTVLINIASDSSHVNMRIRDNGQGFTTDGTDFSAGMGLDIMRQRVEEMGGSFDHKSQLDSGTTVVVHIPLLLDGSTGAI